MATVTAERVASMRKKFQAPKSPKLNVVSWKSGSNIGLRANNTKILSGIALFVCGRQSAGVDMVMSFVAGLFLALCITFVVTWVMFNRGEKLTNSTLVLLLVALCGLSGYAIVITLGADELQSTLMGGLAIAIVYVLLIFNSLTSWWPPYKRDTANWWQIKKKREKTNR